MRDDAGFTLIEALVALVLLAVSGIALLGASETHVRRVADLETRAIAQWVAENRMAELSVGATAPESGTGAVTMLGSDWSVRQIIEGIEQSELADVEIVVAGADAEAGALSRYRGFIDTGAAQ